jgi:DNA-binding beta-propeller fold protein YncE
MLLLLLCGPIARADDDGDGDDDVAAPALPTGQHLTPAAATGADFRPLNPGLADFPHFLAGEAIRTEISPDGRTLLILTSGYNRLFDAGGKPIAADSGQYVFVFDIAGKTPVQRQVLHVPNTDMGLAFAPDGTRFYVAGGGDDDVHVFARGPAGWTEAGAPIPLGHAHGVGLDQSPDVAGLAVSADGRLLLAANQYNDSLSVIDPAGRRKLAELDLRPGIGHPAQAGVAGGEYPYDVVIRGNTTAYVSSQRDREIDVVSLADPAAPAVIARIPLAGNPNRLLLDRTQRHLFATADNADTVYVIDTARNRVVEAIRTTAPPGLLAKAAEYRGAAPNALALSPDERRLYVTNGGSNALAVIGLDPGAPHRVLGLIPTGWYPNAVSVGHGGQMLYVVNGRSDPGPDPANCAVNAFDASRRAACLAGNQYVLQLEHAGFLSLPVPGPADLDQLTRTVAANDGFSTRPDPADGAVMRALHARIRHVIYIIKENRTYDQVLGDLDRGNGDPRLVEFGARITPNQHRLADDFVTLDNFYASGSVSGDGWPWSTAGREADITVKTVPQYYAKRGAPYDSEGDNRNVDVGLATLAERRAANPLYPPDANLLPGTNNVAAPDGPQGEAQRGYLWDSAMRAGLSVRNYGFFLDLTRYFVPGPVHIPPVRDPFAARQIVAYPANPQLAPVTDPYYRGFDNEFPDYYREEEWARAYDEDAAHGTLPALSLVRLMHDHTGSFATAIDRVNTPETQVADNDAAVGRLVAHVAHSRAARSTLIFIVEDDAQNGPDHVDAHRTTAFIIGPYVRRHAVVSRRYTTVNLLRTIEDVLGIDHLTLNDAYQRPMSAVFDLHQSPAWDYTAVTADVLAATDLPHAARHAVAEPAHPAAYWVAKTAGYDWSAEDRIDAEAYDRILWAGLKGDTPYPTGRSGEDLSFQRP